MVRFGLSFSLRETLRLAGGSVLGRVCSLWGLYGTQRRFQVPDHRRLGGDTEQSQSRGGGLVRSDCPALGSRCSWAGGPGEPLCGSSRADSRNPIRR